MNKIISISVWGDNPRYCLGAVKNAHLAKDLMPEWKCRVFVDDTVPIYNRLLIKSVSNVELVEVDYKEVFGAFWRFYSMFDSEDNITIFRDSDSRISEREVRCVNEWIESDKKFSIIRDHGCHYEWPMLAGMWGIRGCLDESYLNKMNEYSNKYFWTSDQVFLTDVIWPLAKDNSMIHGFREVDWMRESRDANNFIGQGYNEKDEPIHNPEGYMIG